MYNSLYNFDKPARELFLDLVRLETGVELNSDEIVIGTPVALGRTKTQIAVSAIPGSNLKGTIDLTYERLDLNRFFQGISLKLETSDEITPELVSQYIQSNWFVFVDPEDIELSITDYGEGLPKLIIASTKETSIGWVGNIQIWALEPNHMSIIFGQFDNVYSEGTLKRNAFIYSIEKDLVDPPIEMINYAIGGRVIHTLTSTTIQFLDQLNVLTGDTWTVVDNNAPFNLRNAEVTYHGPLDETNTTFVIVIQLSILCQNLFGNLILRYTPS